MCIQTPSGCFHLSDPQKSQTQYYLPFLLFPHLHNPLVTPDRSWSTLSAAPWLLPTATSSALKSFKLLYTSLLLDLRTFQAGRQNEKGCSPYSQTSWIWITIPSHHSPMVQPKAIYSLCLSFPIYKMRVIIIILPTSLLCCCYDLIVSEIIHIKLLAGYVMKILLIFY